VGFRAISRSCSSWSTASSGKTLEAISEWEPQVRLDPEDHAAATFDDALVVVDPTDPERNVAAVVSDTNVARVIHHARAFLADPDEAVFEPDSPEPLDAAGVREHVERRGTTPLAVVFDAPDLVDDQLYPQLYRSRDGLVRGLEKPQVLGAARGDVGR